MQTKTLSLFLLAILPLLSVQARLGESIEQSGARYGVGQEIEDPDQMILKNTLNMIYQHGDWIITVAFLNNVAVRISYELLGLQQARTKLEREDVLEILEAEDPNGWHGYQELGNESGKAYTGEHYPPPVLRSARGLTAYYRVFQVIVEQEAAVRHERGAAPVAPKLRRPAVQGRRRVAL